MSSNYVTSFAGEQKILRPIEIGELDKPKDFINDVYEVLDDDGVWVLQMSYTPLMIEQMAFDNICHEHIYYYSLFNLKKLIEKK